MYSWDDEAVENLETVIRRTLVLNTNIAAMNYNASEYYKLRTEELEKENQQLRDCLNEQTKIITNYEEMMKETNEETKEYKELFDKWWKNNNTELVELEELNNNEDAVKIDEILQLNDEIIFLK